MDRHMYVCRLSWLLAMSKHYARCDKCGRRYESSPVKVGQIMFASLVEAGKHFGVSRERIRQCVNQRFRGMEVKLANPVCYGCEKDKEKITRAKQRELRMKQCCVDGCAESRNWTTEIKTRARCRLHYEEYLKNISQKKREKYKSDPSFRAHILALNKKSR